MAVSPQINGLNSERNFQSFLNDFWIWFYYSVSSMTIFKADFWITGFPPRENKSNIKRFFFFLHNTGKLLTLIKTDKNWPQPFAQQKPYNIQKSEAGKICL